MVRPQLTFGRHDKESTMNAKQQREWEDDVTQPCAFPEPLAEVLTRENRELRNELAFLRDDNAQLVKELGVDKIHAENPNDCPVCIHMEIEQALDRAERAEAELADATTAAQNLRDELQGAQERLRTVELLADLWDSLPMPHTSDHDAKGRIYRISGKREAAAALRAALAPATSPAALDAEP